MSVKAANVKFSDTLIIDDDGVYDANDFNDRIWEPFYEWVSANHPDDVAVMYSDADSGYSVTDESRSVSPPASVRSRHEMPSVLRKLRGNWMVRIVVSGETCNDLAKLTVNSGARSRIASC